jgi:predicted DNA-binding transcriptional regulator AlpA
MATNTQVTERLLSAKALGEMLSLSKRQIFRLNCCHKLPAPIRIGGSVRWVNSTIENWINMGCPDRREFEARKEAEKC